MGGGGDCNLFGINATMKSVFSGPTQAAAQFCVCVCVSVTRKLWSEAEEQQPDNKTVSADSPI